MDSKKTTPKKRFEDMLLSTVKIQSHYLEKTKKTSRKFTLYIESVKENIF